MKSGPGFIELRKIEALREIAETLARSRNVTYLVSGERGERGRGRRGEREGMGGVERGRRDGRWTFEILNLDRKECKEGVSE